MKKLIKSFSVFFATFLILNTVSAQNYWRGGFPGNEKDWNTAQNWNQNKVPDWTQNVIIPDVSAQSGYFPVINELVNPIPHLEIQGNALLTILDSGKLVIDGKTTFNSGLVMVGDILAKGDIEILNTALVAIDRQGGQAKFDQEWIAKQ